MIKTFNDLVDECIEESNRVDLKSQIISLAYSILNKIHSIGEWRRDYEEAQFFREIGESSLGKDFSFKLPNDFRKIRAVCSVGPFRESYLQEIYPSKGMRDSMSYYYQLKDNLMCYHFDGIHSIKFAYYKKCHNFIYYNNTIKAPAIYDNDLNKWQYLSNGKYVDALNSLDEELKAIGEVTDWILKDYFEMVKSGVLNRVFSIIADDRYKIAYSTYQDTYTSVFKPNESLGGSYGINHS